MSKGRVDLKTLANHLGVSQATVSRALAGHTQISAKTRQRVTEAAEALGYRPNEAARRLATGRTNAAGLVFPLQRLLLAQTNFVDVLAGITEALNRKHFDLVLAPFGEEGEEAVIRRLAAARSIDGIIITRARVDDPRVPLLKSLGIPFVVHGRTSTSEDYAFVDIDNEAVFFKSASLLLSLGHRRIVMLNGLPEFSYAAARARGFLRAYEEQGLRPDPAYQFGVPMTEESGYAVASEMLAAHSPPTAFLCGSVFLAQGVYRAVHDRGLKIGRDVSVIAHDDKLRGIQASSFTPQLTATEVAIRRSGELLGEILVDQIVSPSAPSTSWHQVASVELVVRESISRA
ncbi:substrate-binding domain-containing protein [Burkholderia arboris]|uniref:substrate-binding domain-containing protein n=1 Tax=Burkholderia arboris TaxID=488730 RepID=UPI001CF119A0|nr:substrate-binding domain-containing protein [Burkholderia arboris]MCA8036697.1 substrate-binding domain-containing protein [Burkholderia arboris]